LPVRVGLFHEADFPFRIHFCGFGNCVSPRRRGGAFQQRSVLIQGHHPSIFDLLPFRRLWYGEPNAISNPINYAKFYSRSHAAVIRVCDEAGNVIATHEHKGEFKEP
jgi:hypothetical protein